MDIYFLTDRGRRVNSQPLGAVRSPEELTGSRMDRGLLMGLSLAGPASYEQILEEVLGETDYIDASGSRGAFIVTERDIRASLNRLYEAGLIDKEDQ